MGFAGDLVTFMIGEDSVMNRFEFIERSMERWSRRHYTESSLAVKCIESENGQ